MEQTLEASEARYRALLDGIEEGYFEVNLAGDLTAVNRGLCEILGYSTEELIGLNNRQYTTPKTAKTMYRIFNQVFRTGQRAKVTDFEVICKDGSTAVLELSTGLMHDEQDNPTGYRGMVRDISDKVRESGRKQRMEAQRQQVQKMEAIETLAGSMALDFNNLLMSIQGNASLMGIKVKSDQSLKKNLDRINNSVDQGIHLTKQLLSFAKVGKFVVTPTDLNPIVQRSTRMFARNRATITFKTYLKNGLWLTDVDRVQMGQAMLALFMRAADDMPDGGDICIETDNVTLGKQYLTPYGLEPGSYVRVSVTDSGSGLNETAQRRIFEPYFSANGTGEQRDMGLAAVYGILKSHDGLINVYSEKGHGTTFNLYLPVSKKESADRSETTIVKTDKQDSLLLVDDDEAILNIGVQLLRRLGYRTLTASTGETALSLFCSQRTKIRAIILDMIMPDMSAGEIFSGIKAVNPAAIIFLASGFSRNREIERLLDMGFDGFFQKPFNRKILASHLGKALNPPPDKV